MEARKWTKAEQERLFDDYFGPSEGMCPVCGEKVCMLMSYLGRTVTLLLSCNVCRNKVEVNRALPLEGPIKRVAA
jgi:formate dehydrogenase maturation protein FdhE